MQFDQKSVCCPDTNEVVGIVDIVLMILRINMGCESISVFFMDNFDVDIEAMRRAKGHSDILLTIWGARKLLTLVMEMNCDPA